MEDKTLETDGLNAMETLVYCRLPPIDLLTQFSYIYVYVYIYAKSNCTTPLSYNLNLTPKIAQIDQTKYNLESSDTHILVYSITRNVLETLRHTNSLFHGAVCQQNTSAARASHQLKIREIKNLAYVNLLVFSQNHIKTKNYVVSYFLSK